MKYRQAFVNGGTSTGCKKETLPFTEVAKLRTQVGRQHPLSTQIKLRVFISRRSLAFRQHTVDDAFRAYDTASVDREGWTTC